MDRKAFYNLEYGVFMLSSRSGEKLGGCIINTCFQAASGPARLAISCINGNYTPELIRESSLFDLTVLDRTVSFDTIRHFGMQSGRDTDKFASFEHAVDENGIPYLTKEANAVFRCRVVSSQDLGSHTLFIGEVLDAEVLGTEKSLTYAVYQSEVKPKPEKKARDRKIIGWRCRICGFVYEGTDEKGNIKGHTSYVDSVSARGQRIMKAGPDTCAVMVWDRDWLYNGHRIYMQQVYSMHSGSRELEVDIYFKGETPDDLFATGAQKLEIDNQGFIEMLGRPDLDAGNSAILLASWGRNVPDKNAPDLIEGVGIGVKVPLRYVATTIEDDINYLAVLRPVDHHIHYTLSVCSLRENEGPKSADEWFNLLRK